MGTTKFRKAVTLAVSLAVVGSLAACSSSGGGEDGDVVLQLAATSDASQEAFEEIIAAFEAENDGITVETTFSPTDAYQTNIPRAMESSNGPDVVMAFPAVSESGAGSYALQAADLIVDQADADWAADIPDAQKTLLGRDGFVAFKPVGFDTIGVIYNEDVFSEAGVEPATTWSDMLTLCSDLSDSGVAPMSFGLQSVFVGQFIPYALVASTVYAEDPLFDEKLLAGVETFAGSGWEEGFDKLLEMRDAGCFNEGYQGTTYEAMLQQVATGAAAMTVTVAPSFTPIREANPSTEFSMFPLPAYDNSERNGVPQALSVGMVINKQSENIEAAQQFVDFANQPENTEILAGGYSVIPFGEGVSAPDGLEAMLDAIETERVGPFPNQLWVAPGLGDVYNAGVQQLINDETTIDDLVSALDGAYEPLD